MTVLIMHRTPDIFNLVQHQQKTLTELRTKQGWDLTFRRMINDWELNRVNKFYSTLENFGGLQEGADRFWWNGHSSGSYKVSSAYKVLNQTNQQVENWPWKHTWKTKIPHKVACFAWLFTKEASLSPENLMRRGISLCPRCYL